MTDIRAHRLKSWPRPFAALKRGDKTHETRKDDRDFQLGDYLLLEEFNPDNGTRSGNSLLVKVGYLSNYTDAPHIDGVVVMSVRFPNELEMEQFNGGEITWLEPKA